jgi:hypothetical protein
MPTKLRFIFKIFFYTRLDSWILIGIGSPKREEERGSTDMGGFDLVVDMVNPSIGDLETDISPVIPIDSIDLNSFQRIFFSRKR